MIRNFEKVLNRDELPEYFRGTGSYFTKAPNWVTQLHIANTIPRYFLLIALALPLLSCAAESDGSVPGDVSDYITSRDNCDSLRGDIPEPDPADPDNLSRVISDINKYCKGTDQKLKQLKEKYSGNESIVKLLSTYEENIEADMSF